MTIIKTVYYRMNVGPNGTRVDETIEELHELAEFGADAVLCEVRDYDKAGCLEMVAERVLPAVADVRSAERSEDHHGLERGTFVHGLHRRGQSFGPDM
jgi:hypothetical protein